MFPGTFTIGDQIRRKAGTRKPFMKYIVGGTQTFTIAEHNMPSGAIDPDASSARGALTVAASNHATPATPEGFSSRGPAFRLFDVAGNRLAAPEVRPKPDLAAADGVATSVTGFNPFFGTSAAAPSAAGVAALILSAKPALTLDACRGDPAGSGRTIDCTTAPDCPTSTAASASCSPTAVEALDTSPPVVTPVRHPGAPDGANGWYTAATVVVAGPRPTPTRRSWPPPAARRRRCHRRDADATCAARASAARRRSR